MGQPAVFDLGHRLDVARGGGNENLIGLHQVILLEDLFCDGRGEVTGQFNQDVPCHAGETPGREGRCGYLAIFDHKNIGGRAFSHLIALVEEDDFVVATFAGVLETPDVLKPGGYLGPSQRGSGVAALGLDGEVRGFGVGGQVGGVHQHVDHRRQLVALPEAKLVVDEVKPGDGIGSPVDARELEQVGEYFPLAEVKGEVSAGRVALEALPVSLEGEGLALVEPDGGEESPSTQQASLARGKTYGVECQEVAVLGDEWVHFVAR